MEIVGIIGAFLLAFCGVPQSIKCLKDKTSSGISWGFINMWAAGEVLIFFYVLFTSRDWILLSNYLINILTCIPLLYYKINDLLLHRCISSNISKPEKTPNQIPHLPSVGGR